MNIRFVESFIHNIATMATYIHTSSKRLAMLLTVCLLGMSTMAVAQTVSPTDAGKVDKVGSGSIVDYKATPSAGYYFSHWEQNGTRVSTLNPFNASSAINYTAVFVAYEEPTMVDLGLSDGTRWASFNLGATAPEECGQYYAWGEINPKQMFTQDNYTHTDNNTPLASTDDAAAVHLGKGWHMPSDRDIERLLDECNWELTTVNGVKGHKISNKTRTDQFIFLPLSGVMQDENLSSEGTAASYWATTLFDGNNAYAMILDDEVTGGDINFNAWHQLRYVGATIRPVQSQCTITVVADRGDITMTRGDGTVVTGSDKATMTGLYYGEEITINIVAQNANRYYFSEWADSEGGDKRTRTVAVKGNETYTAYFAPAGAGATSTPIDLGLKSGVQWAGVNVGAATPYKIGPYYAVGEISSKSDEYYGWSNYKWATYNESTQEYDITKYSVVSSQLTQDDDAASNVWDANWRTPTKADWEELLRDCDWEQKQVEETDGYLVTGPSGKTIFLPMTGYAQENEKITPNTTGYYMSSTIGSDIKTNEVLFFGGSQYSISTLERCFGQAVRPVHVKKMVDVTVEANDAKRGTVTGSTRCVEGTNVEITAVANAGFTFVGWKDGDTNAERTVSVNQNTTYTAIFEPINCKIEATLADTYGTSTIAITADDNTVISGNTVQHGTDVTITVTKDDAFEIVRWIVDGEELKDAEGKTHTDLTYTFTAHDNTTIEVEMKESIVTLPTFLKDGEQGGTVTIADEQGISNSDNKYIYGEKVYLTPQPNTGYEFTGWSDKNTDNPREITAGVTSTNFTANFERKSYDLSDLKDIDAYLGTVTTVCGTNNGPIFYYGDEVTITFNVNPANEEKVDFITWTDQDPRTATISRTVTMNDDFEPFKLVATRLVDLGTSVLWSQINIGATTAFESGDYFAWGETTPVNGDSKYTFTSHPNVLPAENDAAAHNWGGDWRTPTADELGELLDKTTVKWEKKTNAEGVFYWQVTNLQDEEQYIELPLWGYQHDTGSKPVIDGSRGDYFTSSRNTANTTQAYYLQLGKNLAPTNITAQGSRNVGRVIRPVQSQPVRYTLTLTFDSNEGSASVEGGAADTYPKNRVVTVKAEPKAGYRFKQWQDEDGGVYVGNPLDIKMVKDITLTALFEPMVSVEPAYVDLGLEDGTLWATFNLGATTSIESGDYFAWGELHAKDVYNTNTYTYTDNPTELPLEYDAAHVHWGGDWRMPKYTEMTALKKGCDWTVVRENGVLCYKGVSKVNGNTIVLPICGYINGSIKYDTERGDYLSANRKTTSTNQAYYMQLDVKAENTGGEGALRGITISSDGSRHIGRMIRPVRPGVKITVVANDDTYGTVTGAGSYVAGAEVKISATPNDGYYFQKWEDGVSENPRTITVSDHPATYTAIFAPVETINAEVIEENDDKLSVCIPAPGAIKESLEIIGDGQPEGKINNDKVQFTRFGSCQVLTVKYKTAEQNVVQKVRIPLVYANVNANHVSDCDCDVHVKNGLTLTVSEEKENNSLTLHGTSSLVIAPTGTLALTTTIVGAVATDDVTIQASDKGRGTLIMKGYTNGVQPVNATVQIYAPQISNNPATRWNAIGVPAAVDGVTYFRGSWVYKLQHEDKSWVPMKSGTLYPFTGYLVTQKDNPKTYNVSSALEYNTSRTLDLVYAPDLTGVDPHQKMATLFANSWTAPIPIKNLTAENFSADVEQTICLVEKGNYQEYTWENHQNRSIMPMEAFFVTAKEGTYDASITLEYIEHVVGQKEVVRMARANKDDVEDEPTAIELYVNEGEDLTDRILLVQRERYTAEFDNGADATKMMSGGFPNIAVQSADTELGIYATNNLDSTLLNFYRAAATTYTLSFDYTGAEDFVLKDFYTGNTCDITNENTYTFEATGSDVGRFAIFKKRESTDVVTNLQNVWISNDMLIFSNPAGERTMVAIYSADGKLVQTITTADTMTEISVPAQGVYFIQLTTSTTTQTIKQIF